MTSDQWDPLYSSESMDSEIINAAKKREIKNILKSYVGMYDSFAELIQNAMDAVDRRAKENDEEGYERKLWMTINLSENSFSITDNGIGFNEKEFKLFLAPNISFKDDGSSRGNKGVGSTYIAYGFDYLQLGTKGNDHYFIGEIKKGREWVEDYKGIVTRPVVTPSILIDSNFESIDRGSTFTIKYGEEYTRPKSLKWFSATTPEQWLYLLLIKTPLGCIFFTDEDNDPIKFDLKVIDSDGQENLLASQNAEYIYPHLKISASVNLKDIYEIQRKLVEKNQDPSNIPNKFFKSNGVYEFFNKDEIKSISKKVIDEYSDTIDKYKVDAYGYFTYSTSIWDQLNDNLAKLRKGYRVLKGGLQLANNRMPQGDLLSIPLTSNIGYQNQCHVIVHLRQADPDLGRKGFQPELRYLAEAIAVGIVNRFKKWKKLLKTDTGVKPSIEKEMELHAWIKEQEKYEEDNPLTIENENFFIPINEISITSKPQSEQDVIVLFNQLIAGGVIRGIKLLATSQIMQYDGIYKFEVKEPLANHIFDKEKNPLGVQELQFSKGFVGPPKILEYKYNMDALIREFENEEKAESDISLVVVWELGAEWRKNYEATSLLDLSNLHQREFHGLTHILHSNTSRFYAICLSELINYLEDVDGAQKYQKDTYSDELS